MLSQEIQRAKGLETQERKKDPVKKTSLRPLSLKTLLLGFLWGCWAANGSVSLSIFVEETWGDEMT